MKIRAASRIVLAALCFSFVSRTAHVRAQDAPYFTARRVLLISIDGLHAVAVCIEGRHFGVARFVFGKAKLDARVASGINSSQNVRKPGPGSRS